LAVGWFFSKGRPEEVKRCVRDPAEVCLVLVHRQLQPVRPGGRSRLDNLIGDIQKELAVETGVEIVGRVR
jgi:hypothetical protein